ncbi:DUF6602 domain-containing protein [Pedobacter lusitanus]|uniref:DUF6602 domain-containing protein n=1 Tax=Pedobacter lusitanus TaxID=1503925 RepID=UPI001F2ED2BF|nr:DUF6602 domain-containing protein [Pedobacter lusitanus]
MERLSRQIEARFNQIEAIYNFEHGNEFEVALCQLLAELLPDKYGVCRGVILSHDDDKEGDDIIIYDRMNFPSLRGDESVGFSLRQQIPFDAVYAYIECKHAIEDYETLNKALSQVAKVKELLFKRQLRKNKDYDVAGPIYNGKVRDWPRQEPEYLNQPYGVVFARRYKSRLISSIRPTSLSPDLMILGKDHIGSQTVNLGPDGVKGAIFVDEKCGYPLVEEFNKDCAFGLGIIMLLNALSSIQLEPINWNAFLNNHFSEKLKKT